MDKQEKLEQFRKEMIKSQELSQKQIEEGIKDFLTDNPMMSVIMVSRKKYLKEISIGRRIYIQRCQPRPYDDTATDVQAHGERCVAGSRWSLQNHQTALPRFGKSNQISIRTIKFFHSISVSCKKV